MEELMNKKKKQKKLFFKVSLISVCLVILFLGCYGGVKYFHFHQEMKRIENLLIEKEEKVLKLQEEYLMKLQNEKEKLENSIQEIKEREKKLEEELSKLSIVGVGDSVMLGAVSNLSKKFPNGYFDAKVSRSIWAAHEILLDLKSKDKLKGPIILNLGANGDCSKKCKKQILEDCGDRDIFWVTVTNDEKVHVNDKIKDLAKQNKNLHIIDWEEISKNHEEYFYKDGIHLTSKGRTAYTNAITDALLETMKETYQKEQEKVQKEYNQNQREKISFYGNSAFFYSFDLLVENFSNALFNVDLNMSYSDLEQKLKNEISEDRISNKIVLSFDKKSKIQKSDYEKLIELCGDSDIYIVKNVDTELDFQEENVHIIDFYKEIKEHKEYLLKDKVHLSEEGNKALISSLKEELGVK